MDGKVSIDGGVVIVSSIAVSGAVVLIVDGCRDSFGDEVANDGDTDADADDANVDVDVGAGGDGDGDAANVGLVGLFGLVNDIA